MVLLATLPALMLWWTDELPVAITYALTVVFAVLIAATVLSGGGVTFGRTGHTAGFLDSYTALPGGRKRWVAAVVVVSALLVATPLVVGNVQPAMLGMVIFVEVVIVLVVMTLHGRGEYGRFRDDFNQRNGSLSSR
jgi:hypothetical protein